MKELVFDRTFVNVPMDILVQRVQTSVPVKMENVLMVSTPHVHCNYLISLLPPLC